MGPGCLWAAGCDNGAQSAHPCKRPQRTQCARLTACAQLCLHSLLARGPLLTLVCPGQLLLKALPQQQHHHMLHIVCLAEHSGLRGHPHMAKRRALHPTSAQVCTCCSKVLRRVCMLQGAAACAGACTSGPCLCSVEGTQAAVLCKVGLVCAA